MSGASVDSQEVKERLISGMEYLKKGSFYFIVASVFGIVAGAVFLVAAAPLLKAMKVGGAESISFTVGTLKTILAALIIVLIIEFILSILAFKEMKDGAELVGSLHESLGIFSTGAKLMWYGFIGLLFLYPAFIALLISILAKILPLIQQGTLTPGSEQLLVQEVGGAILALGGVSLLLLLAALAVFIGGILFGLGLYRVPQALHDLGVPVASYFDVAGILMVVGAILVLSTRTSAVGSLLFLVAAFLLYKAADNEIELLKKWHPELEAGGSSGESPEPTL